MNSQQYFPNLRRDRHRPGFTLVEILVVLGIIGLILSIALPVTFKARRQASRTRALRDLEALHIALDEFKNSHNVYPQIYYPFFTPNTDPKNAKNGAQLLYAALVGIDQQGNKIVEPKSNRPIGAMINVENFQVTAVNGNRTINDSNGKPYLYFPGTVPSPDITKKIGAIGLFVSTNATRLAPNPLYNFSDAPTGTLSLADMQSILGDTNKDGMINPGETASSTAPYLLWAAGPDGTFGLDTNKKTDDVTSFEIPAQFVR